MHGMATSGREANDREATMSESVWPAHTLDESLFCRLLEGPGTVHVDIVRLDRYFAPFVTFLADDEALPVQYGAIVRGRYDLLAVETVDGLLEMLCEIAGSLVRLRINFSEIFMPDGVPIDIGGRWTDYQRYD